MAMLQSFAGRNQQCEPVAGQRWQISVVHLSQFEVISRRPTKPERTLHTMCAVRTVKFNCFTLWCLLALLFPRLGLCIFGARARFFFVRRWHNVVFCCVIRAMVLFIGMFGGPAMHTQHTTHREHLLHRALQPMAATQVTQEMYEDQSFLRRKGLLTFLRQILEPLDEFHITLENSLTQGIPSQC